MVSGVARTDPALETCRTVIPPGGLSLGSRRSPQRHCSTPPALPLMLRNFSEAGLGIGHAPPRVPACDEFQRAHRLGPKRRDGDNHTQPIIACFLRHTQARQLLQKARKLGPFRMNDQLIRMMADFSKETSKCRKAFLALRPRLRQLEVKFGLFELARMWITKNNVSKDFYDPIYLRLYLDSLSVRPVDTAILPQPQNLAAAVSNPLPPESTPEQPERSLEAPDQSSDLERLSKNYDDRGQVLHALIERTLAPLEYYRRLPSPLGGPLVGAGAPPLGLDLQTTVTEVRSSRALL
ncbi:hypothetical protein NDU88_004314 [Pleurodeles waltl]|uniref:Uncharacterized protein n=1 Tax=Pleurodeles waltl TaxID=8319 RepID=A0AAV7LLB6_PLEWA|nr:hypothetical protein NDU88_004314 [Pleurodeles waltl]